MEKCMFGICEENATEIRYAKVWENILMDQFMNKIHLCCECAKVCDEYWDQITTKFDDPYDLSQEGFELDWYTGEEL